MPVTRIRLSTLVLALVACMAIHAVASAGTTPLGTAFTFQGRLTQSGNPVDGATDLIFTLFETAAGATQVGTPQAINAHDVVDGAFTVELDFGAGTFGVNERWIEIQVRHPAGSGSFTTLSPRQLVTAAPVAMFAMSANGAGVIGIDAANITSGTMNAGRMPTGGTWALSSNLNLDTNLFVIDPVTNRIGVGTVPTVQAFEVFGSSGPAATSGNGGNGIFRIKPSATSAVLDIGGTGSPAHGWIQYRDL